MSRWLGYTAVATLIAFTLTLVPGFALAAKPTAQSGDTNLMAAQLHYHAGRKAYDQGDYETAIREWTEAQRIKASPKLDYNIGLAYEKFGRPRDALAYYYRFLQQSPDAPNRAEVEAKLPALQAQAEQPAASAYPGQGQPPAGYQGQPPPTYYQGQPPPPGPYFPPPVRKKKRRLWWVVFPVVGGVGLIVGIALLARALTAPEIYYRSALTGPPLDTPPAPANDGALFRF